MLFMLQNYWFIGVHLFYRQDLVQLALLMSSKRKYEQYNHNRVLPPNVASEPIPPFHTCLQTNILHILFPKVEVIARETYAIKKISS